MNCNTTHYRANSSSVPGDPTLLLSERLILWPMFYRGFIEHVGVRAGRLMEIADELFSLAPIRHLTLGGVPEVVDQLAAWPHLQRVRSLSLPLYGPDDALTDETLAQLLASPHLTHLTHLDLVWQTQLTARAYEDVVSAQTLPMLSHFVVTSPVTPPQVWAEQVDAPTHDPNHLSYFEQFMDNYPASDDLRDTPKPVIVRSEDWVIELERKLGYVPCVHPEEHYGRYVVDVEAVVANPIALDPAIMARRGQTVPDPGSKPSLMARRRNGLCAICGNAALSFERGPKLPADYEPWGNPMGNREPTVNPSGIWICERCGSRWNSGLWPELDTPPPRPEEL